jgi:hypothetical protein
MSDKKETAVSWLVEQVKSKEFTNDMYCWHKEEVFRKALEMESKKQQKYDEMLEMLEKIIKYSLTRNIEAEAEQLIEEAKKL